MTTVDLNALVEGPSEGPAQGRSEGLGEGEPLLLGGSLGTTLAMWDPQLPELTRTHRVIRFDHRGHGRSPAPPGPYTMDDLGSDVVALLDRLGLERVSYIGLSLGGMVGQWLAINAPERVARLILISTSARMPPPESWHERAAAVRAAGTTAAIADAVLGRWFTPGFGEREPEVVAHYREMVSSSPADGYAACCEAIADMDLRAALGRIAAPTLVLVGAQDPSTPPDHARTIAGRVPGARLEVLDPGAHLLNVERDDDVTALIRDHLERPA
jgi:3-oxoadipate enol-lactonase